MDIPRPKAYWTKGVNAYVDNKTFPLPLTRKQRSKYKQTWVSGHLRKASEGVMRGCTKPLQDRRKCSHSETEESSCSGMDATPRQKEVWTLQDSRKLLCRHGGVAWDVVG